LNFRTAAAILFFSNAAIAGCSPSSDLSDEQVARALAEAIRLNHVFGKVEGAPDSISGKWSEWLLQEGITHRQLERSLEDRGDEPARWIELMALLDDRKDSLFARKKELQTNSGVPD